MNMKTVFCTRMKKELPALSTAPFPGELGERILQNISQEGWQEWLGHQTKLINEFRLRPADKQAKSFLKSEMIKFLFEGSEVNPPDFTPE